MSPVLAWGLRYGACVALGLAMPSLPAPVRPFVVLLVIFASWALLANDIKKEDENENLRDVPLVPAPARARYRPRRVQAPESQGTL